MPAPGRHLPVHGAAVVHRVLVAAGRLLRRERLPVCGARLARARCEAQVPPEGSTRRRQHR